MRFAFSNYPIGVTWKCEYHSRIGFITLSERNNKFEVWRWSWRYNDGSGGSFDWATSYRACKKAIPVYGRFKRV